MVTYYVPPNALVTLVGFQTSPQVTASYFYGLAHGRNPRHIQVMAPGADALKAFGCYIEIGTSTTGFEPVLRLGQVYHP